MNAAAAFPNGYQAIVVEGSSTGAPLAPEGTPGFPRNLAVVFSPFDELPQIMWGVPRADEVTRSEKLARVFGTHAPVQAGRLYGSIADGTARMLYTPVGTHRMDHISTAAIADSLDWFSARCTAGRRDLHRIRSGIGRKWVRSPRSSACSLGPSERSPVRGSIVSARNLSGAIPPSICASGRKTTVRSRGTFSVAALTAGPVAFLLVQYGSLFNGRDHFDIRVSSYQRLRSWRDGLRSARNVVRRGDTGNAGELSSLQQHSSDWLIRPKLRHGMPARAVSTRCALVQCNQRNA